MSELRRISFDDVARDLGAEVERRGPAGGGPGGPGGQGGPGGPQGGPPAGGPQGGPPAGGPQGGPPAGGPQGGPPAGGPQGGPPAGGPQGGPPAGGPGGPSAGDQRAANLPRNEQGLPVFTPEMSRQSGMRLAKMWPAERALKLFDYFAKEAETGEPLEFEGHPACWAMMALVQYLKNNKLYMYMPPFGKSLTLEPFKIGDTPVEGQLCTYEVEEKGENVHLTATLNNGGNPDPFAIPFGENVAPAIAAGKNIYIDLVGAHYIAVFPMPWTYPDCKAMFMRMSDATYCVVSNTPEYKVGQTVENPF